jgi:hypothetical protein
VTTGWLRRNRWGLVLLVPALALGFYTPVKDAYAGYWEKQPHRPVGGAPGGWVTFADARMRVEKLTVDTGLKDFLGEPFQVADGAQPWRAAIDFDTRDQDKLAGCEIELEATNGDLFAAGPSDLIEYDTPIATCKPLDDTGAPSDTYQTVAYFLLPPGIRPAAVRIILSSRLPAYARLTPP